MSEPQFIDRVLETSSTIGTGPYELGGAITGYQTFSAVGDGNSCYYCAIDVDGLGVASGDWEVGLGTYTASGATLSRDSIEASSNGGDPVDWQSGSLRIFLTVPGAYLAAPPVAVGAITGLGTGVATALALNTGAVGGFIKNGLGGAANQLAYWDSTGSVSGTSLVTFAGSALMILRYTIPQLETGYDASNYVRWTVGSTGAVAVDRGQSTANNFAFNIAAGQFRIVTSSYDTLPALGASGGKFALLNDGGLYGLLVGVNGSTGNTWFQGQRVDATATAYDLEFQPTAGNVGIGMDPVRKLDVTGTFGATGISTFGSTINIGGTADRATTEGTNQLKLFNGTAPVGTLANGISLYSTAGELRVMDAAGNATLLSPHEKCTNYWIYDSVDTVTGARLRIDVEQLLRKLNEMFGWDFVHDVTTEK